MIAAFLATWLFALSSVAAKRSVSLLGSSTASLVRIVLAATVLGIYSHGWGAGLGGVALGWFIVSGLIGFGICDTAIFLALPLLGAQLTSLMVQCLAAPIAAVVEWAWLGTRLGTVEVAAGASILVGVAVALFPGRARSPASGIGGRMDEPRGGGARRTACRRTRSRASGTPRDAFRCPRLPRRPLRRDGGRGPTEQGHPPTRPSTNGSKSALRPSQRTTPPDSS